MNKTIHTKWGNARLNEYGYYVITSSNRGNHSKMLHRLIYESVWGGIPKNWIIHHLDGDKTNNCILNLLGMERSHHSKLHNPKGTILPEETKRKISDAKKGEKNYWYGKQHSEETRNKMSKARKGKKFSDDHRKNLSKSRNTTGYYRVTKQKDVTCKQGFRWKYVYSDNGKTKALYSTSLDVLQEKVKGNGLEWRKIDDLDG